MFMAAFPALSSEHVTISLVRCARPCREYEIRQRRGMVVLLAFRNHQLLWIVSMGMVLVFGNFDAREI